MQYILEFFRLLFTPFRLLFTSPQQLIATPRRMLSLSLAARIAILVAIFLVLSTVLVLLRWASAGWPAGSANRQILIVLAILSLVIPVVTYQTLKLWFEGAISPFPDIDEAWQKGMGELERRGMEITQLPLFLVIGSAGEFAEKALFDAAKLSPILQHPEGQAALHWYATAEAIYLVATEVGGLSAVAAAGQKLLVEDRKLAQSRDVALPDEPARKEQSPARDIRRTINSLDEDEPAKVEAVSVEPRHPNLRKSIVVTNIIDPEDSQGPSARVGAPRKALRLDDGNLHQRRLAYLCQRIRRARQPFCPLNGVLALIPYGIVQRHDDDAAVVQSTAREDLAGLARSLRLKFPVVALVTGMESEEGFCELVRRLGRESATEQRLGKGYLALNDATPDQLRKLCSHACNRFEGLIYGFFKEKGALVSNDKAPGNRKLFTLLCRVRRDFKTRLDKIMGEGIGQAALPSDGTAAGLFVGGCYFAATGDTPQTQGFARGVVKDRLIDESEDDGPLYEDLEWAPSMLREDARYRRLAYAGFVIDAILFLATAGLLFKILAK